MILLLNTMKVPVFILSTREPKQIKEWWDKQGFSMKAEIINSDETFFKELSFVGITRTKLPAQIYGGGVMKIPKKVQRLIDRREKLAKNLIDVCNELDTWLEKNGADFNDSDLVDSTVTGCRIYCEPENAKSDVEDYIKNRM